MKVLWGWNVAFAAEPNWIFLNSVFHLAHSSFKSNFLLKWIYLQSCVVHVLFICVEITPNSCIVPVSWHSQAKHTAKEKPGTPHPPTLKAGTKTHLELSECFSRTGWPTRLLVHFDWERWALGGRVLAQRVAVFCLNICRIQNPLWKTHANSVTPVKEN